MPREPRSWGHALQRLTPEEIAEMGHHPACTCGCRRGRLCTMGRRDHEAEAAYLATYQYVTGRQGRVSWAGKRICEEHAAAFAAKHGIDLAAVPTHESPRHALERIVAGGEG